MGSLGAEYQSVYKAVILEILGKTVRICLEYYSDDSLALDRSRFLLSPLGSAAVCAY